MVIGHCYSEIICTVTLETSFLATLQNYNEEILKEVALLSYSQVPSLNINNGNVTWILRGYIFTDSLPILS
jgi:hypothetical protein